MLTDTQTNHLLSEWSYDHFICLTLLYASHADFDFSDNEKAHIISLTSESIYDEVYAMFDVMGDYEQLGAILSLKERFVTSKDEKEAVMLKLKEHFNSDGNYTKLEEGLFAFLDRLF